MGFLVSFPPLSQFGKIHLASSILMALIVIAMEAAIAGVFFSQIDVSQTATDSTNITYPASCATSGSTAGANSSNNAQSIMVYLIIFILAQIFQFYLVLDALNQQNTIQVIMHVVFIVACLAYSIIQYFQISELLTSCHLTIAFLPTNTLDFTNTECNVGCQLFKMILPFIIVSIVILAIFAVIYGFLAFKLYLEFGWKIYKKIGAAPETRSMYRGFHVFIMLLKLDVFFFEAFAIQFLYLVLHPTDPEYGLTIAAICLAIPIVLVAYWAVCNENWYVIAGWAAVLCGIFAYYIFKIVRIYNPEQAYKYVGSGRFLTLFAAIGLFVTVLSFLTTIYCWYNFGKGLKPYLTAQNQQSEFALDNSAMRDVGLDD